MSNLKVYAEISKVMGKKHVTLHYIQARLKCWYNDGTISRRLREMGAKSHRPPKGKKVNGKRVTAWTYSI